MDILEECFNYFVALTNYNRREPQFMITMGDDSQNHPEQSSSGKRESDFQPGACAELILDAYGDGSIDLNKVGHIVRGKLAKDKSLGIDEEVQEYTDISTDAAPLDTSTEGSRGSFSPPRIGGTPVFNIDEEGDNTLVPEKGAESLDSGPSPPYVSLSTEEGEQAQSESSGMAEVDNEAQELQLDRQGQGSIIDVLAIYHFSESPTSLCDVNGIIYGVNQLLSHYSETQNMGGIEVVRDGYVIRLQLKPDDIPSCSHTSTRSVATSTRQASSKIPIPPRPSTPTTTKKLPPPVAKKVTITQPKKCTQPVLIIAPMLSNGQNMTISLPREGLEDILSSDKSDPEKVSQMLVRTNKMKQYQNLIYIPEATIPQG